jgi:hypothetical protein
MSQRRSALTLIVGLLAALSVPASAKDPVVESIWTAVPLTVDGVAQEWENATPIFDKASGAQYALKNDGKDLYIIMVLRGDIARSTIEYTGMKIFLAAGGAKTKDAGVLFLQKKLTPDELIASLEKKGEVLTEERKAEIRKQKSYDVFLEEAIVPKKGGAAPAAGSKPEPALFRSIQKGQVAVYEFKVPLGRIGQPGEIQPGGAIKVGFEWGGMTKEIMKSIMAGRASSGAMARQSAGSSESGFRDESGGGEGGGGDFAAFTHDKKYSKHAFWIDVKLAAPAK